MKTATKQFQIFLLSVICNFLITASGISQTNSNNDFAEPCYFDNYIRQHKQLADEFENKIQTHLLEQKNNSSHPAKASHIKTIPVVVHIIHIGGFENISVTQVQSAIDVLNEDYGKLIGTPGDGAGVDTKVRFCLAKIDPNGNCTNGIVRIKSSLSNHKTYERAMLKELSFWDNEKYLNMYIVKTITGGVLGYSSYPGGPPDEDGIVIIHNVFGRTGTASASMGRITTHELGHWFGLYHTFNNGCGTDLCTDGDYICDTPPVNSPNYNCIPANTCNNDFPDVNDQIENYMDYSPDACKSMFTAGQKDRLQFTLDNIRTVIWSNTNLIATGCDSNYTAPPVCPVTAYFVSLTPEICVGNSIYFIDISLNDATVWQWTFEGGNPSTSTIQNPTVTYDTIGTYDVTLVVSNGVTADFITIPDYVIVSLPETGDSLSFGQNFDDGIYPPLGITIYNYDSGVTWELDSLASTSGKYSIKINNLINTNYGSTDALILPNFDFTTANPDSIIRMTFNWAYARSDASFSDEMIVLLSTDCGVNFTQVYYKTGNNLVTGPTQTTPFVPDSTQWKNAYIYLDSYQNRSNVQIKIVNVTDGGNNLYIDDIYVGDGGAPKPLPLAIKQEFITAPLFTVYPNPVTSLANLQYTLLHSENVSIALYNAIGQRVYFMEESKQQAGTHQIFIDTEKWSTTSFYLLNITIGNKIISKKIISAK